MVIRDMVFDDISFVADIEQACSLTPWDGTGLLTYMLRDDTIFLVADEAPPSPDVSPEDYAPEIVGYVGLLMVPYESDILNLTVTTRARRQGVATALLQEIIRRAPAFGVTLIHLEVRSGNQPARGLYEKLGFRVDGIRKNYYTSPREDAVLMTLDLKGAEENKHG